MGKRLTRYGWMLAPLPFVLVSVSSRALAVRVGEAVARPLAAAASMLSVAKSPVPMNRTRPADPSSMAGESPPTGADATASAPRAGERAPMAVVARGRGRSAARLFIAADRLMGLTADELVGVRWISSGEGHGDAKGVRLWGVEALGVGLTDGDVVTSIDGRPTRTESEALAAGIAAWSSGEPALHATVVRRGREVAVTVGLPPQERRSPPAGPLAANGVQSSR